jgi:superfamily II DNA helicase RecQ
MQHYFFTVPAQDAQSAQTALNRFCAQHNVLRVDKEFVADGANSYWAICVRTGPARSNAVLEAMAGSTVPSVAGNKKIDYREVLSPEQFARYSRLRELRKNLAESEGVAVYAVFSNEQLASIVTGNVDSLAAMSKIDGVGTGRLERFVVPFLALMSQSDALDKRSA